MASQGGSTDLSSLLSSMQPTLHPSTFQFCTLPPSSHLPALPTSLTVQALFREAEGWTLVAEEVSLKTWVGEVAGEHGGRLREQIVDRGNRWGMLTLEVHSSLLAVGFVAAVSARFRDRGIPSNVVAGYFHDHIFVPVDKADLAMDVLHELSQGN